MSSRFKKLLEAFVIFSNIPLLLPSGKLILDETSLEYPCFPTLPSLPLQKKSWMCTEDRNVFLMEIYLWRVRRAKILAC